MIIARMACLAAVVAAAPAAAPGADDETYDRAWLKEKNWPKFLAPPSVKIGPKNDAETKLRKERFEAAQQELRTRYIFWLQENNPNTVPDVYGAAKRAFDARVEMEGKRADKVALLKEKVAFARVVEKQAKGLFETFRTSKYSADVPTARYFRASAELELLRAEKAAKAEPAK